MKIILSIIFIILNIYANEFIDSTTCKGCHPTIYGEFYDSSHRKASVFENKVHKAMWDLHPDKQKESYTCATCHTPTDLELLKNLEENKKAMPENNNVQTQEAISCVYCHSIKDVENHAKSNKNIISEEEKVFYSANENNRDQKNKSFKDEVSLFGMMKEKSGSPFHKIDYSNDNFYTGKMCMGCHSHMQNDNNFDLCRMDEKGAKDEETNCISCHMPKIAGSATSIKITKEHRFHGFASGSKNQDLLAKYIKIDFKENINDFDVSIKNEAAHNLFLQPLRLAQLKVSILRDSKTINLDTKSFARIIGKDGKPTMPWIADSEIENNMLKANERRVINYDFKVQKDDKIEVIFGYYTVNPKMIEKLNLQDDEESKKFNIIFSKFFYAK
ncbi:MAG: multiheme c-type cytochrome [Arcobacteraceae bacterium]